MFTPEEIKACQQLVKLAVAEDLGASGDLTSVAIIPENLSAKPVLVAQQRGVLAGLPAVALVIAAVDPRLVLEPRRMDGDWITDGSTIAAITGPARSILAAERIALNFLQHLCGVASLTGRFVQAVEGLPCKIYDTRKTTPGWRLLEKYAVRKGGGHNHRIGLHDGVLIKDNHIAALWQEHPALPEIVQRARLHCAPGTLVEIEVDTLEQFDQVLSAQPDIILLDNMNPDELLEAVRRRKSRAPGVQLEASGGVTIDTVRAIAETGVDRISIGALTHSAPALNISLDYFD
jgi:nicotinate-nucleotide pyrophosphorylase (carboxylating)